MKFANPRHVKSSGINVLYLDVVTGFGPWAKTQTLRAMPFRKIDPFFYTQKGRRFCFEASLAAEGEAREFVVRWIANNGPVPIVESL